MSSKSDSQNIATESPPPHGMRSSRLKPVTMAIVAVNKELNSKTIEATPIEQFSMFDGELTDEVSKLQAKGSTPDGASYETNLKTTVTYKATWMPMHGTNQITAPDVRRGEMVMLYQFADVDKYYWATISDDMKLRKLETVIYGFSNTRDEDDPNTPDTMYFVEVSTHSKIMHLHMSDNDGEVTTYDMQFNGKEGYFVLEDGIGNYIKLDSANKQFRIETAEGSFIEITEGDLHIKLSGTYLLEAPTTIEKTDRTQTGNVTVDGNATTTGVHSVGSLATGAGGGSGEATFSGPVQVNSTITGTGDISTTGQVNGSNI